MLPFLVIQEFILKKPHQDEECLGGPTILNLQPIAFLLNRTEPD